MCAAHGAGQLVRRVRKEWTRSTSKTMDVAVVGGRDPRDRQPPALVLGKRRDIGEGEKGRLMKTFVAGLFSVEMLKVKVGLANTHRSYLS